MAFTITKHVSAHDETTVFYTFDELDDTAKDTAVRELLNDPYFFWGDIESEKSWTVDEYFTSATRPEWQAAFDFCQGDGLNLYGDLRWSELLHTAGIVPDFDEADDVQIHFPANRRYTYCLWDISYKDIIIEALEDSGIEYGYCEVLSVCDKMAHYCRDLYDYGCWLILEGYYDPAVHDGQLFDEFGRYQCHVNELEEVRECFTQSR